MVTYLQSPKASFYASLNLGQTNARNCFPRAGTEACPYTENFSNPNGFLSDGMLI
jgi:hypothetical protein